jgi:hypothetical protein
MSKMAQRMSLDETILSPDVLTIFIHCGATQATPLFKLNRLHKWHEVQRTSWRTEHVCSESFHHSTSLVESPGTGERLP